MRSQRGPVRLAVTEDSFRFVWFCRRPAPSRASAKASILHMHFRRSFDPPHTRLPKVCSAPHASAEDLFRRIQLCRRFDRKYRVFCDRTFGRSNGDPLFMPIASARRKLPPGNPPPARTRHRGGVHRWREGSPPRRVRRRETHATGKSSSSPKARRVADTRPHSLRHHSPWRHPVSSPPVAKALAIPQLHSARSSPGIEAPLIPRRRRKPPPKRPNGGHDPDAAFIRHISRPATRRHPTASYPKPPRTRRPRGR